MRRYIKRPKAWVPYVEYISDDVRDGTDITVYEKDRSPRDTGLISPEGETIYATEDFDIGFLKDELNK